MKEVEFFVGPCSKFINGEGWVTEIPVEQLKAKGYVKNITVNQLEEKNRLLKDANETIKQNAVELQKQVDELKEQAIKDTAKEILKWLKAKVIMTEISHGSEPCEEDVEAVMWWRIEEHFKKKFGVEVQ